MRRVSLDLIGLLPTPAQLDGPFYGAKLARLEATVMFEELLRRFPGLELVGEVDRMRATMVPGVKRMPVRLGA